MNNESIESYGRPGESLDQTRERLRAVVDQADADALETVLSGIVGGAEFMTRAADVFGGRLAAADWMTAPAVGLGGKVPVALFTSDETRQDMLDYLGRLEYGGWS